MVDILKFILFFIAIKEVLDMKLVYIVEEECLKLIVMIRKFKASP